MATRTPTVVDNNMRSATYQWTGLLNGDTGAPLEIADYADRSVQIGGTLGTGGSVTIEGSNDGSVYVALVDPQGNALTFTALAKIEQVLEVTRYIRPNVTAGDGSTNFTVTLFGRRNG